MSFFLFPSTRMTCFCAIHLLVFPSVMCIFLNYSSRTIVLWTVALTICCCTVPSYLLSVRPSTTNSRRKQLLKHRILLSLNYLARGALIKISPLYLKNEGGTTIVLNIIPTTDVILGGKFWNILGARIPLSFQKNNTNQSWCD